MLFDVFGVILTIFLHVGSLWEPYTTGMSLNNNSILVSFNPSLESDTYRLHVDSFREDKKKCKEVTREISTVICCFPSS